MSERIHILTYTTATAAGANGVVLGSHTVLNYIDLNGLHHTLEAQPEVKFSNSFEKGKAFISEEVFSSGAKNTDSPFKRMEITEKVTSDTSINTPFTLISEGSDLSAKWALMQGLGDEVKLVGYEYRPVSQNSNTFVGNALQRAGLVTDRLYFQLATDPENGGTKAFFVPGFGNPLANPINGAIPDPISLTDLGFSTQSFAVGDNTVLQANSTGGQAANNIQNVSVVMGPDGQILRTETNEVNGSSNQTVYDSSKDNALFSETITRDQRGDVTLQRSVFDTGTTAIKYLDTRDTHPYNKLEVTKGADGKVTAAQITLDPDVLAAGMTIGQIFGSALGAALGGNSLIGNLTVGAIGGLIGQKFVQVLATSMTADLSRISLNDVFLGQGISVANAGFGVISSFLTAELGHALHIDGFDGQLFNTAVSGFTTSLLIQVKDTMARGSLDFAGAIAAMDWTLAVSNAIDVAQINLGNLLGSYLGHELVPAQTREGAIGGQLFGAIGGFILPGGLGSLIGTILGTWLGNQFGTTASPSAVDLLDQAGDHYGFGHYQSADQGSYEGPDKMAPAAAAIINAYLGAVDGAALDHSKQVVIGYSKNPDVLYVTGTPGNANRSFTDANDAVHAAALDVLQNLEVIGGDLLMKRAHQNSPSNIPEAGPARGGMPGQSQLSGADQLATMAGDLSVAQDYENYLNNREAINALIAANPGSAFAIGWIATFARVNDLGLNHAGAGDFLGGLVGYLDSVAKAGLGGAAANASVTRAGNGSVIVEVKVANGAEVPGALSVFADRLDVSSDAGEQTLRFTVDGGLAARGYNSLGAGASGGDGLDDLWLGSDGAGHTFTGTGGHDILVGGSMNDVIFGGLGWDFIDGGTGNDYLFGQDGGDILRGGRGTDFLYGASGNDTYTFARGDGVDRILDDTSGSVFVGDPNGMPGSGHYEVQQLDAGSDMTISCGVATTARCRSGITDRFRLRM